MSNFIIIGSKGEETSIRRAVFRDVSENKLPNAHYLFSATAKGPARIAQRILTSKKLNRYIKMPMHLHWEVQYKDVKPLLSSTEDNYIIFVPSTNVFERVHPALLRDLKKKHSNCKLVFYFVDGVERTCEIDHVSEAKLLKYLKRFDLVCTYSRTEAEKYGFHFAEIPIWRSEYDASEPPASSLYFSGQDKKRINLLIDIKHRLEQAQIPYHFHIVPSLSSDTSRRDIRYSASKLYTEIVDDVLHANCVLEILAVLNPSATLRYKEAVIYNKKLLTNNLEVTKLPYYDSRWMRYFEKAEDIDLEWLRAVEPVDYQYKGDFSAVHFLNTVEKMCAGQM